MAKNPKISQVSLSKKHQDRLHRERRQTRLITIGAIVVLAAVVLTIAYGVLNERYLRWQRTVAIVNSEKISGNDFREFTRYYRNNLVKNAENIFQIASMFGSDQNALQSFGEQLVSVSSELETYRAGNQALDQLIDDRLIRQEAERLGISVSPDEVELAMQEALRFYPDGTPTPTQTKEVLPTSTLSAAQMTMVPPTPTVIPTAVVTSTEAISAPEAETAGAETPATEPTVVPTAGITATETPRPTATPFTLEGYQGAYATVVAGLKGIEIPEKTLRYVIESGLYQKKVMDAVIGEVTCQDEQVWAQHILVEDETTANDVLDRLAAGEDWASLAAELSTDTSNKDQSGDLGWFSRAKMVKEFEDAAFALTEVGQVSEPVQTQFGWHVIRLLGHEERPLAASDCSQLPNQKFQEWITQLRENSTIEIKDGWREIVPLEPTLPTDIQEAVQRLGGANIPANFSTPAP